MDVYYFLKERTDLIRHFYEVAVAPFANTKQLIERQEPPYHCPPYDDSGEPAYLEEWLRADVEAQLVGRSAVSMLSEALKQFFVTWERQVWADVPCQACFKKQFKSGFLAGYLACFSEATNADLRGECPADLDVIEQVVLARNSSQHASFQWPHVEHDDKTRNGFPRPFFAKPDEAGTDDEGNRFLGPWLHIDATNLGKSIDQVEQLGNWLHQRLETHFFARPPT